MSADGIAPPITYFGGKQRLAKAIAGMFPPHRHYVEVCGGSLAVLLAKRPSTHETVNDIDANLMTFWRMVRDRPDDLVPNHDSGQRGGYYCSNYYGVELLNFFGPALDTPAPKSVSEVCKSGVLPRLTCTRACTPLDFTTVQKLCKESDIGILTCNNACTPLHTLEPTQVCKHFRRPEHITAGQLRGLRVKAVTTLTSITHTTRPPPSHADSSRGRGRLTPAAEPTRHTRTTPGAGNSEGRNGNQIQYEGRRRCDAVTAPILPHRPQQRSRFQHHDTDASPSASGPMTRAWHR
ncbi:DNA adenine methylase [Tsukamurella pseudospumae]|uniref:DNA adenine methylase n=1 Tax=Tsukamurella pseudospumae TaxID=239498 RepID=UPI000B28A87D|nr:DNA adenine methylase [Tsukamurella pseudospumae]